MPFGLALPFVCYLLASGVVLWLRSVLVFGLDNLSMMYVYFPQEGRLVNASIYSVVRHPVYSAVLRVVFALVLWNGSLFALFAGTMGLLTLRLWVHFVEEPELLERFGHGYADYRAQVSAFFNLNPTMWPKLWRFLVTGV